MCRQNLLTYLILQEFTDTYIALIRNYLSGIFFLSTWKIPLPPRTNKCTCTTRINTSFFPAIIIHLFCTILWAILVHVSGCFYGKWKVPRSPLSYMNEDNTYENIFFCNSDWLDAVIYKSSLQKCSLYIH